MFLKIAHQLNFNYNISKPIKKSIKRIKVIDDVQTIFMIFHYQLCPRYAFLQLIFSLNSEKTILNILMRQINLICLLFSLFSLLKSESIGDTVQYRQLVAERNKAFVNDHNKRTDKAFSMKLYSQFETYTEKELRSLLLAAPTSTPPLITLTDSPKPSGGGLTAYLPFWRERRVNWTARGMVSPVKDQGFCGSCYAFAAIADIQSSFLLRGREVDLSEQQIIDCSKPFGNEGCTGGWMTFAFAFAMLKGVTLESNYPHSNLTQLAGQAGACLQGRGEFRIRSYSYTSYRLYDCESLTSMVQRRPVTVPIAIDIYFFFYGEGVLENCGSELNHGVQVTGFVESREENYWMVKNSWGEWWGMDGFAHISRSAQRGNLCEICYAPSYSIL